jgi:hypothetical protein
MMLAPVLTPHGLLILRQTEEALALESEQGSRLEKAFVRGAGHGLLCLGADEVGTALPPVLSYWREFGARYVTALCALPGIGEGGTKPPVPIPAAGELGKMAAAVPPMTGAQLTQRRVACSRVCATCRAGRFQDFRFCDLVHTPRCRNALIISYVERVPWPAFCTAAYAPTTTWDARRLRSWTSNWFSCSCLSVP